jgi:hypothetical protein
MITMQNAQHASKKRHRPEEVAVEETPVWARLIQERQGRWNRHIRPLTPDYTSLD